MSRRILIADPHPAIARLLARMLERLGYKPVVLDMRGVQSASRGAQSASVQPHGVRPTPAVLRSADALLIEPTMPGALALARTARVANPALAILGEGPSLPDRREWDRWLQVAVPVGHLAKPFTSAQLDVLLQQGLAHGDALRRDRAHHTNRTSSAGHR